MPLREPDTVTPGATERIAGARDERAFVVRQPDATTQPAVTLLNTVATTPVAGGPTINQRAPMSGSEAVRM